MKFSCPTVTTTVPSNSNKISAVGSDSYTYDAAGNITDDGTNEYTWNNAGQLAVVEVSSTPVGTYTYDSQNRRTKKVAGANTTHYVYGADGLLYGEYDNAGDLIREYVYLDSTPLAQVDAGAPETVIYLHPDHLGTPRFGTNSGGTQVWAWSGDAFGVGAPSGSATVNIRMPGQYVDAESGLFYNWNRYYNPAIGRYISSDPIGIDGGLNTFGYVGQNPVNLIDPEGLQLEATIAEVQTACSLYPAACEALLGTARHIATKIPAATVAISTATGGYYAGEAIAVGIDWCINQMTTADNGTCSCQHRDVHTSSGQSCQVLRESGVCGGPYKGSGSNSATCQSDARKNAPEACRGCLGHCLYRPAK